MVRLAFVLWQLATFPLYYFLRPRRWGAHCIVLDQENRVLLVRLSYRDGWFFPGGGVNTRETLEEAARREAYEEAGIIAQGPIELLGAYSSLSKTYSDHMVVYVIRNWSRVDKSSFEITQTGFFPLDALPEDVSPGVRRRLLEFQGKEPATVIWEPGTQEPA